MFFIPGITKGGFLPVLAVIADVNSHFEKVGKKNRIMFCQHGRYLIYIS